MNKTKSNIPENENKLVEDNYNFVQNEFEFVPITLDIKPFSNRKLSFKIQTQKIPGEIISSEDFYFISENNVGTIYYKKGENMFPDDILKIYSKPENSSLADFLFEIATQKLSADEKNDFVKFCKLDELYYSNYRFNKTIDFAQFPSHKYDSYTEAFFCNSPLYSYWKDDNLIISNFKKIRDANEVKIPLNPIESEIKLVNNFLVY